MPEPQFALESGLVVCQFSDCESEISRRLVFWGFPTHKIILDRPLVLEGELTVGGQA